MSPPPPASPGRRAPPALRLTEEPPLPFALLPPKKRWAWLWRNQSEATDPVPTHTPVLSQIHATPAAAGAATTNPLAAPALLADAAASSPAAGQKRSSPLPPLSGDHKLHAPPPPDADGKPSTPPPCKRERKVLRRVRKVVRKMVPKGTSSAAARKETIAADAAAWAAGASQLQAVDEAVTVAEEELEPGEFIPEKTANDCNNSDAARQPLLGEEEAAGEEAAVVAGEPEAAEKKLVSSNQGEERGVTTGRQNRMREVFVGALHTDAKEEDVRAALAEAGEITEVRMIMDAGTTTKNRGYCFVRYREPAQARKAIQELGSVKICGKPCRIQALEGNTGKAKIAQRDPFEDYTRNPRARSGSNAYAMETSRSGNLVLTDQGSHMEADVNIKGLLHSKILCDLGGRRLANKESEF
ncbi:nuclear localization sequence-binding protein [Setaria italica]|uniref:nuclear localization sequence-binding protein n=1 Tax=Setaria italica TaxID=4555 RepID=UPI00035108A1|nr:nuclear localization sequence-binding protein [Setaria italica]